VSAAEDEIEYPGLKVDGIMYDETDPIAVVNDQLLHKGESIEGAKVIEITESEVTFEYKSKLLTRSIGEGYKSKNVSKKYIVRPETNITKIVSVKNIKSKEELRRLIVESMIKYWRILLLIFVIAYVYMSAMVHMIANKTGTGYGWLAWIPIFNVFLLCMIAGRSFGWVLLFFVPFGQIIFLIMMWGGICEVCSKSWWLGILSIFPGLNFILAGYLAFSKINNEF
jgi:hypothetical protein